MLLCEQGGRYQHRDLFAGDGCDEGGTQRDFGLAEADVAADHAIHRLARRKIGDDGFNRTPLVGSFLEWKCSRELLVQSAVIDESVTLTGLALCIQRQQFGGDIAYFLRRAAFGAFPGIAAERMQRRQFWRCAGVTRNQMQLRDWNV